jgi:hypothetical protein
MTAQAIPPESPETPYRASFVKLFNVESGHTTLVPNLEGVLENHNARGWVEDLRPDPDLPFIPVPDNSGEPVTFTEMYHPKLDKTHHFPSHPDALQGARDAGWLPVEDSSDSDDSGAENESSDSADEPEPKPTKTRSRSAKADDKNEKE